MTTPQNEAEKSDLDALLAKVESDGVGEDRDATLAKINALLNPQNTLITVGTLRRISDALGPDYYISFGDPLS